MLAQEAAQFAHGFTFGNHIELDRYPVDVATIVCRLTVTADVAFMARAT
jgi:hypothetical protein